MSMSIARFLAAGALMAPLMANAVVYQFNAGLNSANEVGTGSTTAATGVATLFYNDLGTATFDDDRYDFSMSVFGLSGGAVAGTAATMFHIHGPASTTENGPVRVFLDGPLFLSLNEGSTLLVGGSAIAPPVIAGTTFLDMLQGGLAYVNVHTALNPGGAVRGQLIQVAAVAAVPEPETYAMLLAGLGLVGAVARRRKTKAAH